VRFHTSFAFVVSLCVATGAIGCATRHTALPPTGQFAFAERIYIPGIPDFGEVNDYLYRGAQPTLAGIDQLKKFDIDTIVDLRSELHGLIANEREHAEALGIRFINLPGSGWATPKDEEIAQFFNLVREQPRRKVFLHCWLGGDRSGEFIAAYRIAFDAWTPEQAIQEMRAFHYLEFWHRNMKHWVEHFPERLAQSPVLAPFRQMTAKQPDSTRMRVPRSR
jgi:protein-tyrosine phosphatase